jgi:hypothetical protein
VDFQKGVGFCPYLPYIYCISYEKREDRDDSKYSLIHYEQPRKLLAAYISKVNQRLLSVDLTPSVLRHGPYLERSPETRGGSITQPPDPLTETEARVRLLEKHIGCLEKSSDYEPPKGLQYWQRRLSLTEQTYFLLWAQEEGLTSPSLRPYDGSLPVAILPR